MQTLQQQATDPGYHCWVNASAGTGKTKILVDRILRLLLLGCNPEHILCLTFTKAAAKEMLVRLQKILRQWADEADDGVMETQLRGLTGFEPRAHDVQRARELHGVMQELSQGPRMQTIHGFCQALLQQFPVEADLSPDFRIVDEIQAQQLWRQALEQTLRHFEIPAGLHGISESRINDLLRSFPKQARFEDGLRLEEWLGEQAPHLAAFNGDLYRLAQPVHEAYSAVKRQRHVLDYDDIITYAGRLLAKPDIGGWVFFRLHFQVRHLLLDEAQDTSPAQWQIIRTLLEDLIYPQEDGSAFVVGDHKQSIYSFQGADADTFAIMRKELTGVQRWRHVTLEVSYRSVPAVLQAVDLVFNHDPKGLGSDSRNGETAGADQACLLHKPHRETGWGKTVLLPKCATNIEALADEIVSLTQDILADPEPLAVTGKRASPGDILILSRNRAPLIPLLDKKLRRAGIPVQGLDRFVLQDNLTVRDCISLLRFMNFPDDDLNLACLLKSPFFGLAEENLFELCHGRGDTSLRQRLAAADKYESVYAQLRRWLEVADYKPPSRVLTELINENAVCFKVRERGVLDALVRYCDSWEQANPASLELFLKDWDAAQVQEKTQGGKDAAALMTVHGSKGLQAPVVILADHGGVPSLTMEDWLHLREEDLWMARPSADLNVDVTKRYQGELKRSREEEHRRLLYVAMTRAQDRLYVTGVDKKANPEMWYEVIRTALEPHARLDADGRLALEPVAAQTLSAAVDESDLPRKAPAMPSCFSVAASRDDVDDAVQTQEAEPSQAQLRGIALHAWLEHNPGYLERFPELACFLSAQAWAEVEIAYQGRILRPDRIAVDGGNIYVLDYKSGTRPERLPPAYRRQLASYAKALTDLHPGTQVKAFILWIDHDTVDAVAGF